MVDLVRPSLAASCVFVAVTGARRQCKTSFVRLVFVFCVAVLSNVVLFRVLHVLRALFVVRFFCVHYGVLFALSFCPSNATSSAQQTQQQLQPMRTTRRPLTRTLTGTLQRTTKRTLKRTTKRTLKRILKRALVVWSRLRW